MKYRETRAFISKADIAHKRLEQMSMEDCIKFWNDRSSDHYHRFNEIRPMEDEDRWNELAGHLGAWDFFHYLTNSGENFNDSDRFFGYIEDSCEFFSFSTKSELLSYITEDWFVEELMEQDMSVTEYGRTWEVLDGTLLKDTWFVGNFNGGRLFMNNIEGYIIFWEDNGRVLKSDI
jgi:hypothetical protein